MLAKVQITVPFAVSVPENELFQVYSYSYEGYEIRIYPFARSEYADKYSDSENITINDIKAINADTLQIYFYKEKFDRNRNGDFDPPIKIIVAVANDFLARLRYVTNAPQIQPLDTKSANIHVKYFNDDESELPKDLELIKGRGTQKYRLQIIALNREIWSDIHSLNPFEELPIWKNLLLDARNILPEIGPSIVLAFTALEVFISKTLDAIARHKRVDDDLWRWINDRKSFWKEPSVEEQFDFLSRYLIGKSIKENLRLWEGFKNIQAARNSFAHRGIAKIGNSIIDEAKAVDLLAKAYQIIAFLKEALPAEMQWKDFNRQVKAEAVIPFVKQQNEESK